ncbi:MAG: hypothetical protein IKX67_04730 [Bacteroidales bacterium]|nr:hypothetical protein [Bacteroidales bacterium]
MKRIVLIICALIVCSAAAIAQQYRDVVYLKNGSIIKGDVIEQVTGGNIKIKTADGSLFVYPSSEVVKIVKEEVKGNVNTSSNSSSRSSGGKAASAVENLEQFRGGRFMPGLGIGVALGDYSYAAGIIELGGGKDINDQVFLGGGAQLLIPFMEEPAVSLGGFFENRVYFPSASNISFQIRDRLNFSYNFDYEVFNIGLTVMPGLMMTLSPKCDLLLNAGYQLGINPSQGGAGHSLVFQTTFDFHKTTSGPARVRPYHSSGIEIGLGLCMAIASDPGDKDDIDGAQGPCLSIGYRFNPQLSVGLELAPIDRRFHAKSDHDYYHEIYCEATPVSLTARYRFSDKSFSPVGTATFGLAFPGGGMAGKSAMAFLFSPKFGISWRLGAGNGHLELCGGPGAGLTTPFNSYPENKNSKAQIYSMLRTEFTVRYYHTLKWGSNWFSNSGLK